MLRAAGIAYEGPSGRSIEERIRELRGARPGPAVPASDEMKHYASLWQDLYHQRGKVEADYFNGEIVRLGREVEVPTPYNSLLLALITEMAARRERPGKYTVKQLRARLAVWPGPSVRAAGRRPLTRSRSPRRNLQRSRRS